MKLFIGRCISSVILGVSLLVMKHSINPYDEIISISVFSIGLSMFIDCKMKEREDEKEEK